MEPRLLFIGAVVSGLGVAGLISYCAFHVSAEWGIAGLFFLSVGVALLAVYFITERKR